MKKGMRFLAFPSVYGSLVDKAHLPSYPPIPSDQIDSSDLTNIGKLYYHPDGNIYKKVVVVSGNSVAKGNVLSWAGSALTTSVAIPSTKYYSNGILKLTLGVSSTIAKNALKGCLLVFGSSSDNPYGLVREILGNDAVSSSMDLYVKVSEKFEHLPDPNVYDGNNLTLQSGQPNSVPNASLAGLILYPFDHVKLSSANTIPIGVAVGSVDASSSKKATYVQIFGLGHVLVDGATSTNKILVVGSTAGKATPAASTSTPHQTIGYSMGLSSGASLDVAYINTMFRW